MKTGLRIFLGALAGLGATGPMTFAMMRLHRQLPWRERYPLPPHEITAHLADAAGGPREGSAARAALTLANHFAYGAGAGAVYAATERVMPGPAAVRGAAHGVLVWAGSYLGLLPALGILDPATRHPGRRNGLMLAVHVLWGVLVALMFAEFRREERRPAGALLGGTARPHADRP